MYDFYYETLLKDSKKFGAVEGLQNTIIELSDSKEVSVFGAQRLNIEETVE